MLQKLDNPQSRFTTAEPVDDDRNEVPWPSSELYRFRLTRNSTIFAVQKHFFKLADRLTYATATPEIVATCNQAT